MPITEDIGFSDAPAQHLPEEQFNLQCADCGALMRLRQGNYGPYYQCVRRSEGCRGNHSAKPDGSPTGIPANAETRRWRVLAHETFDRIWKGEAAPMTERQAYEWLCWKMGLSKDEGFIGRFTQTQCEKLIFTVKQEYPEFRNGWDRLLGGDSF